MGLLSRSTRRKLKASFKCRQKKVGLKSCFVKLECEPTPKALPGSTHREGERKGGGRGTDGAQGGGELYHLEGGEKIRGPVRKMGRCKKPHERAEKKGRKCRHRVHQVRGGGFSKSTCWNAKASEKGNVPRPG